MSAAIDPVGRVLVVGIPGPALDADTHVALRALRPGAVALFRRNVEGPEQLRALVAALHRLPSRPLVAIDHEGGRVTRLGPPFTAFPAAAVLARAGRAATRAVGEAIGRELASVGIDVDFAPVLDVGSDREAGALGDRLFGNDPSTVAEMALAFAAGLAAAGVLPCGKHFPGYGASALDAHVDRPVVAATRDQLLARDLAPFRAAVGLPLLMTAHVRCPALDGERLATLSPRIVGDLLRGELGFRGALWSDDLAMAAVRDDLPPTEAAVAAIAAGVDGVLICHDLEDARRAAAALRAAVDRGILPAARLAEALARNAGVAAQRRRRARPVALPARRHAELAERVRVMAARGGAC